MGRYRSAWQGSFPYIKECRSCDYADWGLRGKNGRCLRTDGKCPHKKENKPTFKRLIELETLKREDTDGQEDYLSTSERAG